MIIVAKWPCALLCCLFPCAWVGVKIFLSDCSVWFPLTQLSFSQSQQKQAHQGRDSTEFLVYPPPLSLTALDDLTTPLTPAATAMRGLTLTSTRLLVLTCRNFHLSSQSKHIMILNRKNIYWMSGDFLTQWIPYIFTLTDWRWITFRLSLFIRALMWYHTWSHLVADRRTTVPLHHSWPQLPYGHNSNLYSKLSPKLKIPCESVRT